MNQKNIAKKEELEGYKQIGERIVREELQHKDRADYGEKIIENLSKDLEISKRLMFDIVGFYKAYPIVHTLYAQYTIKN